MKPQCQSRRTHLFNPQHDILFLHVMEIFIYLHHVGEIVFCVGTHYAKILYTLLLAFDKRQNI